jgi:threonylcarbamoyladenosine tRNA methylthiotransferase MtaB
LGSLEAGVITNEFLSALKNLNDFAPHFHLSLQSGSNAVLKKMNRRYDREQYLEKVFLIREYFPNAGITTDVIAGFPTETEDDFLESLSLIDEAKFSDIHAFAFSPREGTVAYKMQDLPYQVKKERLDKLLDKKAKLKEAFARSQEGKTLKFLPEEFKEGYTQGYTENYLHVFVKGDYSGREILKIKIEKPFCDGALATVIEGE